MIRFGLLLVAGITLLTPEDGVSQDPQATEPSSELRFADRFAPFDWLMGEWQGYGEFEVHQDFSVLQLDNQSGEYTATT